MEQQRMEEQQAEQQNQQAARKAEQLAGAARAREQMEAERVEAASLRQLSQQAEVDSLRQLLEQAEAWRREKMQSEEPIHKQRIDEEFKDAQQQMAQMRAEAAAKQSQMAEEVADAKQQMAQMRTEAAAKQSQMAEEVEGVQKQMERMHTEPQQAMKRAETRSTVAQLQWAMQNAGIGEFKYTSEDPALRPFATGSSGFVREVLLNSMRGNGICIPDG
jgi:hypothetical protein